MKIKYEELQREAIKRRTKNSMLKRYEMTKANDLYIIYYLFNNKLNRTIVNELNNKYIKKGITSKKKGHKNQLRIAMNNTYRKELYNNTTTEEVMTTEEFESYVNNSKYNNNKGRAIEELEYNRQQQNYKADNTRYDKDGDITINNIKYQIKFENASITTYNTIDKVVNEKLANA